jgi:hypothetical protein
MKATEIRQKDCETCGQVRCDVFRSRYPKFRDFPTPRQAKVIMDGCRAHVPVADIGKGLGYLRDARHNLGG